MRYPFLSFIISILFCLILASIILIYSSKKPQIIVPATIEINALEITEDSDSKIKESSKEREQNSSKPENKETKQQQQSSNDNQTSKNKALIVYGPLPKIPDHLRDEAFASFAIARFHINEDGSSRVELIKPCANLELNYLLLKSLAKWKFERSDKKSVQDIKVNFLVE